MTLQERFRIIEGQLPERNMPTRDQTKSLAAVIINKDLPRVTTEEEADFCIRMAAEHKDLAGEFPVMQSPPEPDPEPEPATTEEFVAEVSEVLEAEREAEDERATKPPPVRQHPKGRAKK